MKKIYKATTFLTLFLFFFGISSKGQSAPAAEFSDWLNKEFKPIARQSGITPATLSRAFKDAKYIPQTVALDCSQPESKQTFDQYKEKRIPSRIVKARRKKRKHRLLLESVQTKYGVSKEIILSLWGLESNFGTYTGNFVVVNTLATLAFEGRRRDFFTKELLEALKILQENQMDVKNLRGSWAGALGQCQFMPSAFNLHAVDTSNKGFKDIWNSKSDVFSSIANYLINSGWHTKEPWGVEVTLPKGFNKKLATLNKKHPKKYWVNLGLRTKKKGGTIPDLTGSLIIPDNKDQAFIVYNNFRVILKWNRSTSFALTVCLFADQLRSH
ncbi:lytic murein transglycosylase [Alphaproteobacteria bacterium]|nr:lytic murein transglycosylase [Alphaproteobacteria bacterium]